MRKIILVPDSFKGTMDSIEVCEIMEKAIKEIFPQTETVKIPMADGGEGTVDAFLTALGGRKIRLEVIGPLFKPVKSFYGILPDGDTAIIEMAAASGLVLAGDQINPWNTTTYGTGQLIKDALDRGCRKIIIGIGGSATNDGGIGVAAALGVRFLDKGGREIPLTGQGLGMIEHIDISQKDERLDDCEIIVACDVTNPLYGPDGAAYVYAPQKGADEHMVKLLDNNLRHFAKVLNKDLRICIDTVPGTGAAGGLGAGLMAFANATLRSGIKILLEAVKFDEVAKDADLIITGEGRIDGQSLKGKVPVGIGQRALKIGVPVIAIVGSIGEDIDKVYGMGIRAVFSTNTRPMTFETAKLYCRDNLYQTTRSIMQLVKVFMKN